MDKIIKIIKIIGKEKKKRGIRVIIKKKKKIKSN